VGHRVVHGGASFAAPLRLDDEVIDRLDALAPLAPGHQPHNLAGVRAAATRWPGVPQVASFDTAFHRTQSALRQHFALPQHLYDEGILRYGFHGLSYDFVASRAPAVIGDAASGRMIVAHLGAGASMCAMRAGRSVATTMGFTAVDGMPMGRRTGAIDAGVLLHLLQERRWSAEAVAELVHRQSGLLGLSGLSEDMRVLETSDAPQAAFAVDFFVDRCVHYIGALAADLDGMDALVFTAGIGEHSAGVRAAVLRRLAWLGVQLDEQRTAAHGPRLTTPASAVSAWVIPTDEQWVLARDVFAVLDDGAA
jgi:acetate kinase